MRNLNGTLQGETFVSSDDQDKLIVDRYQIDAKSESVT